MYAASFFLVAVAQSSGGDGERGYTCAYMTLFYAWIAVKSLLHPSTSMLVQLFPLVIAGLINPVFLVAVIRPSNALRVALVLMIPFCWIVFYMWPGKLYPREGHFLWIAGMLMVLFSIRNTGGEKVSVANRSRVAL
jgi:hypothetical protein